MQRISKNLFFYICSFMACSIMAFTTGCASGGFKLTRQYAGWVNGQNIILRVILYILTFVVFGVTILLDAVVFNTVDFWEGKVSSGNYEFKDGDKIVQVKHEILPGTKLKRSTIVTTAADHAVIQTVVLSEVVTGEIEMFVDGKLHTRVANTSVIPVASVYDQGGKLVEEKVLFSTVFESSIRPVSVSQFSQ